MYNKKENDHVINPEDYLNMVHGDPAKFLDSKNTERKVTFTVNSIDLAHAWILLHASGNSVNSITEVARRCVEITIEILQEKMPELKRPSLVQAIRFIDGTKNKMTGFRIRKAMISEMNSKKEKGKEKEV